VTREDRIKLLFGPSKAPRLKRGDRATCLCRDAAPASSVRPTAAAQHAREAGMSGRSRM